MMDTLQVFLELQIHHQYTFLYFGHNGYPSIVKFYLRSTERHRAGQKERIRLVIKTSQGPIKDVLIDPNNQFVLWDNWVNPYVDYVADSDVDKTPEGTIKGYRWAPYDGRYLHRAIASIDQQPMIWNIKDLKPEELIDYCHLIYNGNVLQAIHIDDTITKGEN